RPEIDDLISRGAEMGKQLFLQTIATVIGGNAYAHVCCSTVCYLLFCSLPCARPLHGGQELFDQALQSRLLLPAPLLPRLSVIEGWLMRLLVLKARGFCHVVQPWQEEPLDDVRPSITPGRYPPGPAQGPLLRRVGAQLPKQTYKLPRIGSLQDQGVL